MAAYWIVKTEPSTYSFDDLVRERTTVWDGVKNPVALKHIRQMSPGDQVLVYHTGDEKAVVGRAEVGSPPRPDRRHPELTVVELRAKDRLPKPVPLAAIKAEAGFKDLGLVRMGRLSVMPASATQWRRLLEMGGAG